MHACARGVKHAVPIPVNKIHPLALNNARVLNNAQAQNNARFLDTNVSALGVITGFYGVWTPGQTTTCIT